MVNITPTRLALLRIALGTAPGRWGRGAHSSLAGGASCFIS